VIGRHFTENYPDDISAKTAARRLQMAHRLGIVTDPRFCESCNAFRLAGRQREPLYAGT
jgi:hypothetical protein